MKHYTYEDFRRYYGGAYVFNPQNERQLGALHHGGNGMYLIVDGEQTVTIDYTQLEWKHVKCPPLGYIHLDDGYRFYHSSKGQHDGVPKGLNPALVNVLMPAETRVAMQRTKLKMPAMRPHLNHELAAAIALPEFVTLDYAVDKLLNAPHAVGYALSKEAGLTLGLKKDEQLVGLYRGRKCCTSRDGYRFVPVADWADGVTERHFSRKR